MLWLEADAGECVRDEDSGMAEMLVMRTHTKTHCCRSQIKSVSQPAIQPALLLWICMVDGRCDQACDTVTTGQS